MLVGLQIVSEGVGPCPVGPVHRLERRGKFLVVQFAFTVGIAERAGEGSREFRAELRPEHQILEGLDVGIDTAEDAPAISAVVAARFHQAGGVHPVHLAGDRTGPAFAVSRMDRDDGQGLGGDLEDVARGSVVVGEAGFVGVTDGEVLAHGHMVLQEIEGGIDAGVVAVVVTALDDALAVRHAQGQVIAAPGIGVAHGQFVRLAKGILGNLVVPVGVCRLLVVRRIAQPLGPDHVSVRVELVSQRVGVRIQARIGIGGPEDLAEAFGIQHLEPAGLFLQLQGRVEVDLHPAFLAPVGGDDDDTVRGAGTIDGGGGGILQDLDGFDVGGVDVLDAHRGGHAVHDVQRVGVVQRTDTADADAGLRSRVAGRVDVHAGDAALEGGHHVEGRTVLDILHGNDRDGTGEVALALGRVTDHDHLVQHLVIFLEHDAHALLRLDGNSRVAETGDLQVGALADIDGELSIGIGNDTVVRRHFDQGGAGNRFTVFVENGTSDCYGLRHGQDTGEERQGHYAEPFE